MAFVEGDARALRFQDRSFDVVVFHTTLCHVPEPERALRQAARVLRPGGWLAEARRRATSGQFFGHIACASLVATLAAAAAWWCAPGWPDGPPPEGR